ncbi:hypothetical protein [Demequina subtropica]|uniref:hypothetical protein n=1 Tax=Demequina subtropica TaxID=1638989 RepID=UPI000A9FD43E|nr:hypothetical protein [Demequina subtropica]
MPRSLELDRRVDQLVARLERRAPGAMTRSAVLTAVGRRGLENAARRGRIIALLPGVYVAAACADSHAVRCEAVRAWSKGRVLIAGESALHLLDSRYPAPKRVRCLGPPAWNARAPAWVDLTRTGLPRSASSRSGVRCLPAEAALLDAWACAPRWRRKDVLYRALWLRIAGPRRLIDAARRRSRLPDRRMFDGIMGAFTSGATSPTEVMARREVFVGPEFAELEWQVAMVIEGRDRTADALHRRSRTVIECDGEAYHGSRAARRRDRERDTEFGSAGWHTVRFSFQDLSGRPAWCRRMVRLTISARLAPR